MALISGLILGDGWRQVLGPAVSGFRWRLGRSGVGFCGFVTVDTGGVKVEGGYRGASRASQAEAVDLVGRQVGKLAVECGASIGRHWVVVRRAVCVEETPADRNVAGGWYAWTRVGFMPLGAWPVWKPSYRDEIEGFRARLREASR